MSSPQHVIVTGGAGFIGSHLVERLLAEDQAVVVIDDCSTGHWDNLRSVASSPKLTRIESAVSACPELDRWVSEAHAIFHLAAAVGVELVVRSPVRTLQTNLHETEAVLDAAARHNVPVLLASTSEVYGRSHKHAFSEEDDLIIGPPVVSRWSYACSKLLDEFLALAYAREKGLPVIITRLFNTVGPRQTGRYGMVLPRFIQAAKAGQPLRVFGDGSQTRCFCHVADAVESLLRLYHNPAARGQVFNVGGTEEVTILQLAQRVVETLQSKSSIEYVPYSEAYAPGFEDMKRRRPIVDKLEHFTKFRPSTSLRAIIERTAAGE